MSHIRFRIRTIMIAIAALAVAMGALRLPFVNNMIVFTAAVVLLVAAAIAIPVLAVGSVVRAVVDVFPCAVYFWRGRTRPRRFSRTANSPFRTPEPDRSEEPTRVYVKIGMENHQRRSL